MESYATDAKCNDDDCQGQVEDRNDVLDQTES